MFLWFCHKNTTSIFAWTKNTKIKIVCCILLVYPNLRPFNHLLVTYATLSRCQIDCNDSRGRVNKISRIWPKKIFLHKNLRHDPIILRNFLIKCHFLGKFHLDSIRFSGENNIFSPKKSTEISRESPRTDRNDSR